MKAVATSDHTVRYEHGSEKFYRSIFYIFRGFMKVSRRKFRKAGDAMKYKQQVLGRHKRLRDGSRKV